jgi:hypothetical protein
MIVVGTLVLSFALFVTAHVAITYGLAFRPPRWRALAALLVVPLAPYWAWREHMRVRFGIWLAALVLYVLASIVARF